MANFDALGNLIYRSDVGTYTDGLPNSRPHAVMHIGGTVNTTFVYDNDGNMRPANTMG